ncbi:MFS transporter [Granulicella cerasi]|uniref:MFS transporter n=1 Tax=Granulicella cerasi TaxID=741063 RepID=A0ABW1Z8T6_9BACT|nr:MFS transporter [Granulicella cerasi]
MTCVGALALTALDRGLLGSAWPQMRGELHATSAQYGSLVSAFSITYALAAPLYGRLLDRYGMARIFVTCICAWTLCSVATGFAHTFRQLVLLRILLGVFEAVSLPAIGWAYAAFLPAEERPLGTALTQIGLTGGSIGAVLLAGWSAERGQWRSAFLFTGIVSAVWIIAWAVVAHRRVDERRLQQSTTPPTPLLRLLMRADTWTLIVASLFTMPIYSLWTNWTTIFLVRDRGMTPAAANLELAWLPPLCAIAGGIAGGVVATRLSRERSPQRGRFIVFASASILLPATLFAFTSHHAIMSAIGIGLSLFITLCMSVNLYAMAADLCGAENAGLMFALLTMSYGFMQTFVSPLIGRWVDRHSFTAVAIGASLLPFIATALLRSTVTHSPEP